MRDLIPHLDQAASSEGMQSTAIPFVRVNRRSKVGEPHVHVLTPSVWIYVAGHKRARVGNLSYELREGDVLAISRPTHVISHVLRAPYVSVMLTIDATLVASLASSPRAASSDIRAPLTRLVRLLDAPSEIPVLAPLIEREMFYRLLAGPAGDALREVARGHDAAVTAVVTWLDAHYAEPFSAELLAVHAHLSVSALYARFKARTGLTPLQYQKRRRLERARGFLLGGGHDVSAVAYRVGYASAAHFSRDYRHAFATSPSRDIDALRRWS